MYRLILVMFLILVINPIIGAIVCATIDNDNEDLYKWYSSAPPEFGGILEYLVLFFWPIVVIFWYVRMKKIDV